MRGCKNGCLYSLEMLVVIFSYRYMEVTVKGYTVFNIRSTRNIIFSVVHPVLKENAASYCVNTGYIVIFSELTNDLTIISAMHDKPQSATP